MTFRDKIGLVVKGLPIVTKYNLILTETSFKEFADLKFANEDDMNPFSLSSKRFVGHFHGYYGREFSVKPKSSFFRKDSLSNSIWIHGKVEPKDEKSLSLEITYHRTNFAKYGQWVMAGSIGFGFLMTSLKTLVNSDFLNFLISGGALLLFYLSGTLISIFQANGQIEYFEKHFINEIEKK